MKLAYVRWMIKTSLVYLSIGFLLGLALFLAQRFPGFRWAFGWRYVHVHLILMGGIIQLIMGVALWMFPRTQEAPHVTPSWQGWLVYGLLNVGTLMRSACEPFTGDGVYLAALTGMVLQVLAWFFFLTIIVRRVRSV